MTTVQRSTSFKTAVAGEVAACATFPNYIEPLPPFGVHCIYALTDPRTNAVRYIGKTNDVWGRYKGHVRDKGPTRKAKWIRCLAKDGLKPGVEVVEFTNAEDWDKAERQWIANFKLLGYDLTNLTEGGDNGWSLTDDAKRRIGDAQRGKKKPEHVGRAVALANKNRSKEWWDKFKARKISEETRQKMRQAALNISDEKRAAISATVSKHWANGVFKPMTPEQYALHGLKRRGQKRSLETRAKMSAAAKRRTSNPEWRRQHSLALTGRKLSPESIAKREATRKRNWLASKGAAT